MNAIGSLFAGPSAAQGIEWLVVTPLLNSLPSDDGSLAAIHYRRRLVSHEQACYTCHSGYGIWGGVDAKMAGVMHMVRTVTGRYKLTLTPNGPFDIDSRLGCHAIAPCSSASASLPTSLAFNYAGPRSVRASGMRMVGPNCMGVLNTDPAVALNATFAPHSGAPLASTVRG